MKSKGIIDPLNENNFTVCAGLVYKYKRRALFEITYRCAVSCEFCCRKWKINSIENDLNEQDINKSLDFINKNKEINEIIISGGDPLLVVDRFIRAMKELEKIDHIKIIRVHTRLPLIKPELFDIRILSLLKKYKKIIYLSIHINHYNELHKSSEIIIEKIRKTGVILYSQSVFLKGINDSVSELEKMFSRLLEIGVRPYLIYHCDRTIDTEKFWMEINKEREIMAELRSRISGLACPVHVIDANLGCGKIPVPDYSWDCNMKSFKDFQGKEITEFCFL